MLNHARFESLRQLIARLGNPDVRRRTGLFWVEGPRALINAADRARRIETLVVCEKLLVTSAAQMIVRRLRKQGVTTLKVSPEQFRAFSGTRQASGVGLVVGQHWTSIQAIDAPSGSLWLAIARLRSSGNLGTILRTAEAAGVAGVFFLDPATDPFNPAVLRGSMGSVLNLPLVRASLEKVVTWATSRGIALVGTSPRGVNLFDASLPASCIIFLGEERQGLTDNELAVCCQTVCIPMAGRNDSINVGVAAGVVLFELRRRSQLISSDTPTSTIQRPAY